ncbi:uncharacterized protein LOC144711127 [Wolffia australiana]
MTTRAAMTRYNSQAGWLLNAYNRSFFTATAAKSKAYASPAAGFIQEPHGRRGLRAEFVPVYVALGLIGLSASLGLYAARHELGYAPNVLVKKKRRESVQEVEDPDSAVAEGEQFIDHSLFRRLAHLQDSPHPSSLTETIDVKTGINSRKG